jgi:hypothetical protein
MRKQILQSPQSVKAPPAGELEVATIATVQVTSESASHPVEHAFDGQRGPGSSHWIAGTPGEQTLILAFDAPQNLHAVYLEVEEKEQARTQELQLAASSDGGQTYRELFRQEFNFAPAGCTFEREEWTVQAEATTHLRLWIRPDKGGRECRASLTAWGLR